MAINSKQKGKRGELEAAHFLTDMGLPAYRSQQYFGAGDAADIRFQDLRLNDMLHIEVKVAEHLNVDNALDQAIRDRKQGQIPLVMHRKKRTEWKVTLNAKDFWDIYKSYYPNCLIKNVTPQNSDRAISGYW